MHHLQVSGSQQQAPDGRRVRIQLVEDDLFVHRNPDGLALHQILKKLFDVRFSGAQQFPDQPVAAGVCPVDIQFLLIQESCDGPWIIHVRHRAESKPVVPSLYIQLVFLRKALFVQRMKDFFFSKAETVRVFSGSCGYDHQIVQVGKDGFLADTGNPGHDASLQRWVGFEGVVEHCPGKTNQIIPVTVDISFLQRGIIFVQKDQHFLTVDLHQKAGQELHGKRSVCVRHFLANFVQ